MVADEIAAEIAREITPHGMDVVRVVLRVVVLDQEGRALNAIVVRLTALDRAGPRECHLAEIRALEARAPLRRDIICHPAEILVDETAQLCRLRGGQT